MVTPEFQWLNSGVALPTLDYQQLELWLAQVAALHNRAIRSLNYVFCADDEIIRVNREFLSHDYYTDIITFDYCIGSLLRGDLYISLDTVESNAAALGVGYDSELLRVIVHGLLHLCGINDKGPGERAIMERHEDQALSLLRNYQI